MKNIPFNFPLPLIRNPEALCIGLHINRYAVIRFVFS